MRVRAARAAAIALAAGLLLVGAPRPVDATVTPAVLAHAASDSPAVDALIALQAEVLLLVERGAFVTVPPALAEIHDAYRSYLVGVDGPGQGHYYVDPFTGRRHG